jgi:MFS family permease
MGDVFGYKRLVIIGLFWYSLWSLVSGLAIYSNKVLFIFARALAGIGPSITLPNALAMLGYAYEPGFKKVCCSLRYRGIDI